MPGQHHLPLEGECRRAEAREEEGGVELGADVVEGQASGEEGMCDLFEGDVAGPVGSSNEECECLAAPLCMLHVYLCQPP